jgi:hypothetical protein
MIKIKSVDLTLMNFPVIGNWSENNLIIPLSPDGRGKGEGEHIMSTPTSILPRQGGG